MKFFLKASLILWFCIFTGRLLAQTDVLTQHNDASRSGWNNTESILNVSNVSPTKFGLLTSRSVDDQIYAQPLVASGVDINMAGSPRNIVYVATVNNTIYAFDADDGTIPVYWTLNLTTGSNRPPNSSDIRTNNCVPYNDFSNNVAPYQGVFGIVGTPVIDKQKNTLWVVSRDVDPGIIDQGPHSNDVNYSSTGYYQYLHAIDIRTGTELLPPVLISATAPGTAPGNSGGIIHFDPRRENQRGGLLLMNGMLYIPYAAHCDWNNYTGWILAYDPSTLQQKIAYITTPNDGRGGIWMSGGGIAADPSVNGGKGSLYFATGNSNYGDPAIPANRGESIVRLDPNGMGPAASSLILGDYFTPWNYSSLNDLDLDFGSQVMLVPNSNLLVTGCKDANLYTFDKANLGGFNKLANANLQTIFTASGAQMHASFAYFGGTTHKYFYQFSEHTNLKAYPVSTNSLGTAMNGVSNGPTGASGSYMATSSNGADETTGILWISHAKPPCNANQGLCAGILRAVNASSVNSEIWNSDMNAVDNVGSFAKMVCPTIANGKVYLATNSKKMNVYGLVASNPQCITNVALNKNATDDAGNTTEAKKAFNGDLLTGWSSTGGNDSWVQVDLGALYDICRVSINWLNAGGTGTDFDIQVSDDGITFTTVEHTTNFYFDNINQGYIEFNGNYSGRYVRMQGIRVDPAIPVYNYNITEMKVLGQLASTCAKPANLITSNTTQHTTDVSWTGPTAPGTTYLVRYKTSLVDSWVTRTTSSLTQSLSALSCGFDYSVEVQSICSPTDKSSFSSYSFQADDCTVACNLPTRYFSADIGDIGQAGSSCLNGGIFTIQGSGTQIGGASDQFQFAFTNLAGDEDFTAHLVSQNLAGSRAGAMMRDSMSDTSPFAYIAITAGSGAQFIYRTVSGGPVTVIQGPPIAAPYYLKLSKAGTVYTAYVSPSGLTGTWVTVGSKDLGFGTASVNPGLAVTSSNNSSLATAVFDLFEETSPLPISLLSFTASNINNEYVSIKWTTSSEENNDRFVLEHSTDGMHFELLTTVKSVGNSSTPQSYSTADNHPANGINFYRMKQYDLDGRVSVFPVALVKFGAGAAPVVYPNPTASDVSVVAGDKAIQRLALYDLMGKEIRNIPNQNGDGVIILKTSNLASGVYILKITTASKVYQQKLMKE